VGAGDPETNVVPLPTGGAGQNPIDSLPADGDTLEAEFIVSRQQRILLRLARELLDDRERQIFFEIHHLGSGRAEVGRKLGLTGQRVGQIYRKVAQQLLDDRERQIFFEIHHLGSGRAEVGRKLGLTGQRVGQIYRKVAQQLLDAARDDPTFRTLSEFAAGGSDDRIG